MPTPLLPVNLTAHAENLRGLRTAGLAQSVLAQPGLYCDQVDAAGLQGEASASAAQEEVYVVMAGYGGVRGADDTLVEVTAGDVLYVAKGTLRRFEGLNGKFLTLRISFSEYPASSYD